MAISQLSFSRNIGEENVFYDVLKKNTPFQTIKSRSSKSRKIDMVLVQKWPFFEVFFLGIIDQENVFYDILEEKNAFLGYKNKKFEQSKNRHFSKGVNPWFWSKNWNFFKFFCLSNTGQENVFYDILQRRNAFLA